MAEKKSPFEKIVRRVPVLEPPPQRPLLPVMNPLLNFYEAASNLVLLEDHLSLPGMNCTDCIRKHICITTAYLKEALTLDKEYRYTHFIYEMLDRIRDIHKMFLSGVDLRVISQTIRPMRKVLLNHGFGIVAIGEAVVPTRWQPPELVEHEFDYN